MYADARWITRVLGDRGHLTQLAEAVVMGRGGHGVMGFRLVKGPAGEAQLTSR